MSSPTSEEFFRTAVQFLAMPRDKKRGYLPASIPQTLFHMAEGDMRTDLPLKFLAQFAADSLRYVGDADLQTQDLLDELRSVLFLMLDAPYGDFWYFDAPDNVSLGRAPKAWEVLERLARELASLRKIELRMPALHASEVMGAFS